MPEQIVEVPVSEIDVSGQPRTIFEETPLWDLGRNMEAVGQLLPIIVCVIASTGRYLLIDGERRVRASKLVNRKTLRAYVLDHEPTALELHRIQMCIAVHNVALSAMEKSDQLLKIKQENDWSISELAEKLNMKQPQVTKLLKFQDGCPELQAALRARGIDQDKAYSIASEPEHERQRELLAQVGGLSREHIRQKAKAAGKPVELKTRIARFPLPKGFLVTVQGPRMSLSGAVDVLQDTLKELKKALNESLDISTAAKIMRDRSEAMK